MKKKKIEKRIKKAIGKRQGLNVYLCFDSCYYNIFPLSLKNGMVTAVHDIDFMADGYLVFPISLVERAVRKYHMYDDIMEKEGILSEIEKPDADMSSFRSVCEYLQKNDISVQIESNGYFYIGKIKKVKGKSVILDHFDAMGIWQSPVKLYYDDIDIITFGNRYSRIFSKYV